MSTTHVSSSSLIGGYVRAIHINPDTKPGEPRTLVDADARLEVDVLKELTWVYVIQDPSLAAQQYGQRRIIRELFGIFCEATRAPAQEWVRNVLPNRFSDVLRDLEAETRPTFTDARVRLAADAVASLTEQQATDMHSRLTGHDTRSVFDPIIR